jgi:NADPH:quinone reductase-like Zn-dependent oxidoreductase
MTLKANRRVQFDRYGDEDELYLAETAVPSPGPGQIVVRVLAAGINPGEISIRDGRLHDMFPATFPSGEGSDFAGRVEAVGAGVEGIAAGQEVLGWSDHRSSHADYVATEADHVVPKPFTLDWARAGSLFVAGATAYAAVGAVAPRPGDTVVVAAAAGGVGSLAAQLARRAGARVIGVAGADNSRWLESIGVEPVTYGDGLAERLGALAPRGIDAFVDAFGGGYVDLAVGLGVPPSRIDTIIDFPAAARQGAQRAGSAQGSSAAVLAHVAELVAWGEIILPLSAVYPLVQVADAYRELARRHTRGKIALATELDAVLRPPQSAQLA